MPIDFNNVPLRYPCQCGSTIGIIKVKNGQNCVYCKNCGKYAGFNMPKSETGEKPRSVTTRDPIKPSQRFRIFERDLGRCVLCGNTNNLHVAHIISLDEGIEYGLDKDFLNSDDNLMILCEECNLGMGKTSLSLIYHAILLQRRKMNHAA